MNESAIVRGFRPVAVAVVLLVLSLAGAGCSGGTGSKLTVKSLDHGQTYQTQFLKAYAGRNDRGDYDVVLIKNGGVLRHVMHVRVLWKPMKGTKLDHPTATNATIDWIITGGPDGGFVAYGGAGFVDLQRSGDTAKLTIRNATLSPTAREGAMQDPIGRSNVSGTVIAHADRRRVGNLLAQVQNATATQARHAPPQRAPSAQEASSRAPLDQ